MGFLIQQQGEKEHIGVNCDQSQSDDKWTEKILQDYIFRKKNIMPSDYINYHMRLIKQMTQTFVDRYLEKSISDHTIYLVSPIDIGW